jgi:hypothetical protein
VLHSWKGVKRMPLAHMSTYSECRRVEVGGPTTYWLFSAHPNSSVGADVLLGARTREVCEAVRRDSSGWGPEPLHANMAAVPVRRDA